MTRKRVHPKYSSCLPATQSKRNELIGLVQALLRAPVLAALPSSHLPEQFPAAAQDIDELWLDSISDLVKEVQGDADRAQQYILEAMRDRRTNIIDRCDIKEALLLACKKRLSEDPEFVDNAAKKLEEKRARTNQAIEEWARERKANYNHGIEEEEDDEDDEDDEKDDHEGEGEIKDGGGDEDVDPEPTDATDTTKRTPSPSPPPQDLSPAPPHRHVFQKFFGLDFHPSPSYVPASPAYDQYHHPTGPYSPISPATKDPVALNEVLDRRKKQEDERLRQQMENEKDRSDSKAFKQHCENRKPK